MANKQTKVRELVKFYEEKGYTYSCFHQDGGWVVEIATPDGGRIRPTGWYKTRAGAMNEARELVALREGVVNGE